MIISACCHTIMFLVFLFLSGTGRAREVYRPQYQVRLVGPQQVASLAPAAKTAKPSPAPQPPKPKPEAKKVVLPDKKPPPPQQKKVEKPPAEKKPPGPKAPEAKPAPKPAPAVEKKEPSAEEVLAEALARIEKRAGSKGDPAASAPGRSFSAWEEKQKEIEYSAYYDQVERAVRANWIPPQHMDFQRQTAMTVVSITLLPDGRVLKSTVEESSGDPQFDQSVMRAILKSTPFPPPPIGGIKQQNFELGLRFHSTPQRR
jgi:colicin import membrane protein